MLTREIAILALFLVGAAVAYLLVRFVFDDDGGDGDHG